MYSLQTLLRKPRIYIAKNPAIDHFQPVERDADKIWPEDTPRIGVERVPAWWCGLCRVLHFLKAFSLGFAEYILSHVDEFIDELLTRDSHCDITLPRLPKR